MVWPWSGLSRLVQSKLLDVNTPAECGSAQTAAVLSKIVCLGLEPGPVRLFRKRTFGNSLAFGTESRKSQTIEHMKEEMDISQV